MLKKLLLLIIITVSLSAAHSQSETLSEERSEDDELSFFGDEDGMLDASDYLSKVYGKFFRDGS